MKTSLVISFTGDPHCISWWVTFVNIPILSLFRAIRRDRCRIVLVVSIPTLVTNIFQVEMVFTGIREEMHAMVAFGPCESLSLILDNWQGWVVNPDGDPRLRL